MSYRQISVWHIMRDPTAFKILGEYVMNGDASVPLSKEQSEFLYSIGVDVSGMEFEIKHCKHRPIGRKETTPVEGVLFIGNSRKDDKWIKSCNASWEERVAVSDPEIQKDLKNMSREFNPNSYMGKE